MSTRRRASSLGPTEMFILREWAITVYNAFDEMPYLVGSVARAEATWRDVDVRVMLADDHPMLHLPRTLVAANVAFSVWGQRATGLLIDFQLQSTADGNTHAGVRIPLAVRLRNPLEEA